MKFTVSSEKHRSFSVFYQCDEVSVGYIGTTFFLLHYSWKDVLDLCLIKKAMYERDLHLLDNYVRKYAGSLKVEIARLGCKPHNNYIPTRVNKGVQTFWDPGSMYLTRASKTRLAVDLMCNNLYRYYQHIWILIWNRYYKRILPKDVAKIVWYKINFSK